MDALSYDVAIMGAGPAGCCAALRLLQLGYSVAVIERASFGRPQIGESLTPGIWNIFKYLQITDCLNRENYISGSPANVLWASRKPTRMTSEQRGRGLIVDRAIMDLDLLNACKEKGATIFQPAIVQKKIKGVPGWRLQIKSYCGTAASQLITITAGCIFDATHHIPKSSKVNTAPASVAVWADLKDPVSELERGRRVVSIEAIDRGWIWSAPLANGQFRVMLMVGLSDYRIRLKKEKQLKILQDALTSSMMHRAIYLAPDESINVCATQPSFNLNAWSTDYIALGGSAFTLDPLSSTGVEKAMRFSMQTVIAYHTLKSGACVTESDRLAQQFYHEKLLDAVTTHAVWSQNYYAQSWCHVNEESRKTSFWSERCQSYYIGYQQARQQHPINAQLDQYWQQLGTLKHEAHAQDNRNSPDTDHPLERSVSVQDIKNKVGSRPLSLSRAAFFSNSLCVEHDTVCYKSCLSHPNLEKPLIYLSNVNVIPLIESLPPRARFSELLNIWARKLSYDVAIRLLSFLVTKGIIICE